MPYLGWCARAFSLVKKDICFEEPALLSDNTPLWHSTLFLNNQRLSYFSPRLIRLGVLNVGQLLEDDSLFSQLAPTWEPIYRRRLATSHPPPPPAPTPHTSLPLRDLTFWSRWTRSPVVDMLSLPHSLTPRQPDAVWQAFHRCNLPPSHKDFIHRCNLPPSHKDFTHRALWAKLPVGQRQQDWKPLEVWCPIDNELESISHALFHCRFLVGAFEVVNTAFRSTGPHPFDVVHLLQDNKPASLETPAGLIGWSAIITNWSLRCAKKHSSFFRITWESFCAKWFHTLNSWTSCPCYTPIPETVVAWFLDFFQRSSQPRPPPPPLTTAPKPSPPPSPFANTPPTPPVKAAST